MVKESFNINDDGLYRSRPVLGVADVFTKELIISKEAFIECYEKWIKGNNEETVDNK